MPFQAVRILSSRKGGSRLSLARRNCFLINSTFLINCGMACFLAYSSKESGSERRVRPTHPDVTPYLKGAWDAPYACLQSKYGEVLRLQLISVVAVRFERVVWETVENK